MKGSGKWNILIIREEFPTSSASSTASPQACMNSCRATRDCNWAMSVRGNAQWEIFPMQTL